MSDPEPSQGERWTIYVCPNCGKRQGGRYFCRCILPSDRCEAIEVVSASALATAEQRVKATDLLWRGDSEQLHRKIESQDTALRDAEAQLAQAREAFGPLLELAAVSVEGDPWYAEHEGLDAEAILKAARQALSKGSKDE